MRKLTFFLFLAAACSVLTATSVFAKPLVNYNFGIYNEDGVQITSGASVQIYTAGTSTAPTIYSDSDEQTSITNPISVSGSVSFFAVANTVDVVVTVGSAQIRQASITPLIHRVVFPVLQTRIERQYVQSVAYAKLGSSGAGWVIGAADSISLATLPASQTTENIVIPITIPLPVGFTITAFSVIGQIESGGNAVTLDANLRKHTAAAADVADASVGTITQISVTADAIVSAAKSGLAEVVAANETFYVVLLGTTAATTDIAIQGITVTISAQ